MAGLPLLFFLHYSHILKEFPDSNTIWGLLSCVLRHKIQLEMKNGILCACVYIKAGNWDKYSKNVYETLFRELCYLLFAQAHKLGQDEYGLKDYIFKEAEK